MRWSWMTEAVKLYIKRLVIDSTMRGADENLPSNHVRRSRKSALCSEPTGWTESKGMDVRIPRSMKLAHGRTSKYTEHLFRLGRQTQSSN